MAPHHSFTIDAAYGQRILGDEVLQDALQSRAHVLDGIVLLTQVGICLRNVVQVKKKIRRGNIKFKCVTNTLSSSSAQSALQILPSSNREAWS